MAQTDPTPDVKAYLPGIDPDEHLSKCSGTEEVGFDRYTKYAPGSFIPRNRWDPLSAYDKSMLVSERPLDRGKCISLVQYFSQDWLMSSSDAVRSLALMQADVERIRSHPLTRHVEDRLDEIFSSRSILRILGVNRDRPNLDTVSIDRVSGKFVGLHIDSWDRNNFERGETHNRISINLGLSNRYFLFVDLTVGAMWRAIEEAPKGDDFYKYISVGRKFMRKFPSYPVTRLLIKPGQAYIAPTENIVHDGSTKNCVAPPFHFNILGNFDLR